MFHNRSIWGSIRPPFAGGVAEDALMAPWITAIGGSGNITTPRRAIVNTLMAGLRTDGLLPVLDRLWILAAANTSQAHTDIINCSTLTAVSSPTFAADTGYTANGAGYLATGFTPSSAGGHFSANSASYGVYILNNRTTGQTASAMGVIEGAELRYTLLEPKETTPVCTYEIMGADFATAAPITSIRHSFVVSRTSSNTHALYLDNVATPFISTSAGNSFGLPTFPFFIMATNLDGTAQHTSVADVFGAAFIGGGMTAAQAVNLSNRINTYIGAIGLTAIW